MSGRYSLKLPVDLKRDAEEIASEQGISLNQLILWSLTEKVTSLKGKLDDPHFPAITHKLDSDNRPVPILRGKGIRVQTIVLAHKIWEESVPEIASQYDLPQRIIREALSFYDAHKKAIDDLIEENDDLESERE